MFPCVVRKRKRSELISSFLPFSFARLQNHASNMSAVLAALHRITRNESSPPDKHSTASSAPHSPRAQSPSPLRFFWPLNRTHSREDPFVPVDPYRFRLHLFSSRFAPRFPAPPRPTPAQLARLRTLAEVLHEVVRQVYRHIMLRLPSIYFSRVSRLFLDADVSKGEMQRLVGACARGMEFPREWTPPAVSPALVRFKYNWEDFVDTVIREWKQLNVVSALLLS